MIGTKKENVTISYDRGCKQIYRSSNDDFDVQIERLLFDEWLEMVAPKGFEAVQVGDGYKPADGPIPGR